MMYTKCMMGTVSRIGGTVNDLNGKNMGEQTTNNDWNPLNGVPFIDLTEQAWTFSTITVTHTFSMVLMRLHRLS